MLKGYLKKLLIKEDEKIAKIEKKKEELIEAFVLEHFKIERWDKLMIKGYTVVVTGFDSEGIGHTIKLLYKRINFKGEMDNVQFRETVNYKFKNLGKYNGKQ